MVVLAYYPADPRVRREAEKLDRSGIAVDVICLRGPAETRVEKFGHITAYRIMNGTEKKESVWKYLWLSVRFAIKAFIKLLQILCIPVATLYMAIGRLELHRLFAVVRTVLMLLLIYPAVKYFGLTGAAMAGLVSIALGFLFQLVRMHKITEIELRRYGLIFLRASGISGSVAALWILTHNLYPGRSWLNLLPGAMGCLLAYALAIMAFLQSKSSVSTFLTASHGKQA